MKAAGVNLRSRADIKREWWTGQPADRKASILSKFAGSQRGIVKALDSKIRQADSHAGRYRGNTIALHEGDLSASLVAVGIPNTLQHPIGPYTTDVAIHERRVAVEIQRANWTLSVIPGRTLFKDRLEYILDAGWSLLVVYCPPLRRSRNGATGLIRERFDRTAVTEKIISLLNVAGAFPAEGGQYGVIDGYGKPTPIVRLDLDSRPVIVGL